MCWNNWLVGIPGIILQYWAGSGKKAGIQKDEREINIQCGGTLLSCWPLS